MNKNSKEQVLRLSQVLREIAKNTGQEPTNAVLTTPALSGKPCAGRRDFERFAALCFGLISPANDTPVFLKAIIELMLLNGLRVSEVLNIKGADISASGIILVKGLKGSNNRFCSVSIYRDFWIKRRKIPETLGAVYSRFFLYREFKKLGISLLTNNSSKQAVTHAFRHMLVTGALSIEKDFTAAKNLVGHKSTKSTHHYDNTSKKSKTKC